jgi:aminobenzoyl-glutamate utilization protein B
MDTTADRSQWARAVRLGCVVIFLLCVGAVSQEKLSAGQRSTAPDPKAEALKVAVVEEVDRLRTLTQQMVDSIFSFGELGFQEFETSRYLVNILKANGFTVEEGIAGIPTAWVATWGSGKPVIALGSDIDGIPQVSQKLAWHITTR